MWRRADVSFSIVPALTGPGVATLRVTTPAGAFLIMGEPDLETETALRVRGMHVEDDSNLMLRNRIGQDNLMVVAQAFMESEEIDELILEGGTRASGRRQGKKPREIRFKRHAEP